LKKREVVRVLKAVIKYLEKTLNPCPPFQSGEEFYKITVKVWPSWTTRRASDPVQKGFRSDGIIFEYK
jgi:hypothetical protein